MARKEINFTLDTMRQDNTSIGTFKQLDDIVLNLTITENGVVKDLTSQDLKIYIAKADKTIIEQREGIEVTGAEEGTVKIELLNAATQVNGITVGELNISDEEGTISTVNFYYNVIPTIANDTVIESTNVIGILKELENILAQAKEDLKGLNEFQTQVKADEQIRQSNEELRVKNEESRESFEEGRKKSENSRRSSESIRNKSEKERESAEKDRKSTESQRETAELGRKTFEEKRISAEVIRQEKEENRQQEEEKRVQTETLRTQAEDKRASGEETRVEAEKVRLSQEAERVTAENERIINEIEREQSEEQRVASESGRVTAESSRVRAEEERTASESQRVTDESKRAESENKRVSDEAQRAKDEKVRVGNEEKRVSGESDRVKSEIARVEAEKAREEQFNKLTDAKTLIDNSKIDENKTWSSKQIIDHLLQDNEWKTYNNQKELTDAANGYIRELTIEGKTEKGDNVVNGVGVRVDNGYKITIKTHNEGSTRTSTSEIILQDQLQEIGDIKDRLYFDEGYKVEKNIKATTLTGEENWQLWSGWSDDRKTFGVWLDNYLQYDYSKKQCLANNYPTGLAFSDVPQIYLSGGSDRLYLTILRTELKEQNLQSAKEWLKNKKITLYHSSKKTTIDTQIKTELLPQTYKNKTYIGVDSGVKPTLKGEYAKAVDFKEEVKKILLEYELIPSAGTLEETEHIEEEIMTTEEVPADEPTTTEEL